MLPPTEIHFRHAQAELHRKAERSRHERAVALNEFRNAHCDHFGMADLHHYAHATGKDIHWLFHHARFSDPQGARGAMASTALYELDLELMELILRHA